DLADGRIQYELPLVEVESAIAETQQVAFAVRHEEQGAATREQLLDARVTLLAERLVAHREHLVDEDDGLLEPRDHGEGDAHLHAAREVLVGGVDEVADLGEVDDLVEALVDLAPRHAVQPG